MAPSISSSLPDTPPSMRSLPVAGAATGWSLPSSRRSTFSTVGSALRAMPTIAGSRRSRSISIGDTFPPPLPRTSITSACFLSCG